MMENRTTLNTSDLDGFDKRKLPSPGFQVEVVLVDYKDPPQPATPMATPSIPTPNPNPNPSPNTENAPKEENKDDVFSDNESEERKKKNKSEKITQAVEQMSLNKEDKNVVKSSSAESSSPVGASEKNDASISVPAKERSNESVSEFKAIAADASVFSFGDEDDYESE